MIKILIGGSPCTYWRGRMEYMIIDIVTGLLLSALVFGIGFIAGAAAYKVIDSGNKKGADNEQREAD